MKAWIARDSEPIGGELFIYFNDKPYKADDVWISPNGDFVELDKSLYPEIQWTDDEPTEVEVTIKIKQK